MPLDEVGRAQVAKAASKLAGLAPTAIVSSDLGRAVDTATALADRTGLSVAFDPDLRETFAGEWQGLDHLQLRERYGDALDRWAAGEDLRPGGNGETRTEVADRVVAAIERAAKGVEDGGTLVVATHGGAARVALGRLIGLPSEHWAALGVLSNAAWSVLSEVSTDPRRAWRLVEYNAGSLPLPALGDDR